jgi:hypothetical protein
MITGKEVHFDLGVWLVSSCFQNCSFRHIIFKRGYNCTLDMKPVQHTA